MAPLTFPAGTSNSRGHVFERMVALLEGQSRLDRPLHINLRRIPLDI
jgi:hypothetical protein